ncbi:hypothetical protein [Legionella sp. W05-934-2]|jgi:hypothetical protein|uniref:hypothetical protein n=1 Tax=Legionella sp. W05-934-2 TaxID=1198649 RepID=UPI003461C600
MDSNSNQPAYNTQLLPSPFPIFIMGSYGVVNHEVPGSQKKMLPTDNSYTSAPGCYIACYSHNPGIYSVSESISVMGQIRVAGEYDGRVCQPSNYKGQDISKLQLFKDACAKKITGCENGDCWAGGDTGGWFGIQ